MNEILIYVTETSVGFLNREKSALFQNFNMVSRLDKHQNIKFKFSCFSMSREIYLKGSQ